MKRMILFVSLLVALMTPALGAVESRRSFVLVEKGDNLSKIAKRTGLSLKRILLLNPQIRNANLIFPGDTVFLTPPEEIFVVVKPGDNLTLISRKFDVSISEIVRRNRIKNPDLIFVGQVLAIPLSRSVGEEIDFLAQIAKAQQVQDNQERFLNPLGLEKEEKELEKEEKEKPVAEEKEKPVASVSPEKEDNKLLLNLDFVTDSAAIVNVAVPAVVEKTKTIFVFKEKGEKDDRQVMLISFLAGILFLLLSYRFPQKKEMFSKMSLYVFLAVFILTILSPPNLSHSAPENLRPPMVLNSPEDDFLSQNIDEIMRVKVMVAEEEFLTRKTGFPSIYQFIYPLPSAKFARITSGYGPRRNPVTGKREFHHGVDLAAPLGAPVVSISEGKVLRRGRSKNAGRYVMIVHRGRKEVLISVYAHLKKILVKSGQVVRAGEKIGEIGMTGRTTGPHLHFALMRANNRFLNPTPFVKKGGGEKFVKMFGIPREVVALLTNTP